MIRIIERINGEFEIKGLKTATDGIYIPARSFAEENNVPESTVRQWKKRRKIEACNLFGRLYVLKNTNISARKYVKNVQK